MCKLIINVEDTGRGIKNEEKEKLQISEKTINRRNIYEQ